MHPPPCAHVWTAPSWQGLKFAQEIAMLLEDDNVNAGAREQETKHEPARSTSNDAVTGGECSNCITSLGRTHLDKVVLSTAVDQRP
jgi:hypothetical protein